MKNSTTPNVSVSPLSPLEDKEKDNVSKYFPSKFWNKLSEEDKTHVKHLAGLAFFLALIVFGSTQPAAAATAQKIKKSVEEGSNIKTITKTMGAGSAIKKIIVGRKVGGSNLTNFTEYTTARIQRIEKLQAIGKLIPDTQFRDFFTKIIRDEIIMDPTKFKMATQNKTPITLESMKNALSKGVPIASKMKHAKALSQFTKWNDNAMINIATNIPQNTLPSLKPNMLVRGGFVGILSLKLLRDVFYWYKQAEKIYRDTRNPQTEKERREEAKRRQHERERQEEDDLVYQPRKPRSRHFDYIWKIPGISFLAMIVFYRILGRKLPEIDIKEHFLPERKKSMFEWTIQNVQKSGDYLIKHPHYIFILWIFYIFRYQILALLSTTVANTLNKTTSLTKLAFDTIQSQQSTVVKMAQDAINQSKNFTDTIFKTYLAMTQRDQNNLIKEENKVEDLQKTVKVKDQIIFDYALNNVKNENTIDQCNNSYKNAEKQLADSLEVVDTCKQILANIQSEDPKLFHDKLPDRMPKNIAGGTKTYSLGDSKGTEITPSIPKTYTSVPLNAQELEKKYTLSIFGGDTKGKKK